MIKLREGGRCLQSVAGYLGLTLVCVLGGELREGYNCYFGVFLVVWEVSFLWGLGAGHRAIFYGI